MKVIKYVDKKSNNKRKFSEIDGIKKRKSGFPKKNILKYEYLWSI